MNRRFRALTIVFGSALAISFGLIGTSIAVPRLRRAKKLRELIGVLEVARAGGAKDGGEPSSAREALVGFEEPEALLALLTDLAEPDGDVFEPSCARRAVELFACGPETGDPRPRAALEALARAENASVRTWGAYLLEELDAPLHAREPSGFSRTARVSFRDRDGLAALRAVVTLPIDAPELEARLRAWSPMPDGEPPPPIEDSPWRVL